MPASVLLRLLDEPPDRGPDIVSTVQAAKLLGYSPKWWRVRCADGLIEGARVDGGRWRFPLAAGRAYLAARSRPKDRLRGVLRGPRKSTPARHSGASPGEARPMVERGLPTVRRQPLHIVAEPETPGVA